MADFTPGPWRIGGHSTCVVTDNKVEYTHKNVVGSPESDREYYGGYLIAETQLNKHNAELIIAAPDMYKVLSQLVWADSLEEFVKLKENTVIPLLKKVSGKF